MAYTMSEAAFAARRKKRNLSEEEKAKRRELMMRIREAGKGRIKMQPRIRVMCDKAMYEEVVKNHGNIDNAMRVMLGK